MTTSCGPYNPMSTSTLYMLASFLILTTTAEISTNVSSVRFLYYPSPGNQREIFIDTLTSFDPLKDGADTLILIDGFLSNSTSPMAQIIKNSALKTVSQQNILVVDWGRLSGSEMSRSTSMSASTKRFETWLAYTKVLGNVGPIGSLIADFLHLLQARRSIHPGQIHILGHSLGAHIAGAAGSFYKQRYGQEVGRITGLDPAGLFFSLQVDPKKRLDSQDASFVDMYHTNRGTLGDSGHQTGHINVYVNGGNHQPGCEEKDLVGFAGFCSHSYSWKLYNATYRRRIMACPCIGFPCQCKNNCKTQCRNPIDIGVATPSSARGAYHLIIRDPFSN